MSLCSLFGPELFYLKSIYLYFNKNQEKVGVRPFLFLLSERAELCCWFFFLLLLRFFTYFFDSLFSPFFHKTFLTFETYWKHIVYFIFTRKLSIKTQYSRKEKKKQKWIMLRLKIIINKINEKSKFVQSEHRCSCDAVKRIQLLMKLVKRV